MILLIYESVFDHPRNTHCVLEIDYSFVEGVVPSN